MAEDNASSHANLGVLYGVDENINKLNGTNLNPCSTESEDNQNTLLSHSHAVSIIQKLTEFKEYSTKTSEFQNFNHVQNDSLQASLNCTSSKLNMRGKTDEVLGGVNELNAKSTSISIDTLSEDGIGKEHHMLGFPDCRNVEVFKDSHKKTFSKTEDIKQALASGNLLENHSEAGPDVAEFSEEELRSVAELFKEPSAFDFFQKASNSKLLRESPLGRLSLFVKLDSVYKSGLEASAQDSGLDISGDSNSLNAACGNDKDYEEGLPSSSVRSSDLAAATFEAPDVIDTNTFSMKNMDKTSSSHQMSSHCVQETKLFTEEEFTQALKMQELLFHEKQLKREKDRGDQAKNVEKEKQMMKNQIVAMSKSYRASRAVLEELLSIFSLWLTVKEQERVDMTTSNQKAIKERDQALEDLQSVESAFADLHRRYENCKAVLEGYKQNEDRIKQQVTEMQLKLKQQEQMYEMLRARIQDKLDSANAEIESAKKSGDAEVTILRAQLKKAEMKMSSLEKDLEQKNKENIELGIICDDLIAKVGKT